ncbi:DUF1499 domain-containing protein [Roseibium denhamense]|uniref:DUF1499 domain-containing protein n=1 Tax=Roseibium denhamense TaxID=76305 RepID=A0ABY1P5K3_9HYPH|nr:DUF1499 domain-containing protein [Roseibium denhamense]MTI07289.1 DUF1499 domain-containing protein [Roseibium denhamense]SMP26093.1 Protein of unknown function [Roseibium denhamense]
MKRFAVYKTVAAPVSRTVGSIALALALVAVVAKRFGFVSADTLLLSLAAASAFAITAVVLGILALQRIWTFGGSGVGRALGGMVLGGVAIIPPALIILTAVGRPDLKDVATNLEDPPELSSALRSSDQPVVDWFSSTLSSRIWPVFHNVNADAASSVSMQTQLYPDIVPRRYRIPPAQLHVAGTKAVEELGWQIVDELPPDLLDAPTWLQAESRTHILGLKQDIAVRFRPDPVGTLMDVRSRSRTPLNDLSGNADRIRILLAEVDRVLLETYGDLSRLAVEEAADSDPALVQEPLVPAEPVLPVPGFKPYFEEEDTGPETASGWESLEG